MNSRVCFFFFLLLCALTRQNGFAQCDPFFRQPLSLRPANYEIHATLDDARKTLDATQTIRFTNTSPAPIPALRLYMYLNAFKNTQSSFLKGTDQIFGQPYTNRSAEEWGWIEVEKITRAGGSDLSAGLRYVQPDDGNPEDQTVLEVPLDRPIEPGETAVFQLKWRCKMPKTIARSGFSKDFYLFCHWFPQLGVWEEKKRAFGASAPASWDWNCHQFFRSTEFYADFGVYDVHITLADKFVMGASGCLVQEKNNGDGTVTRHYHVEDVIDFAWSVYPRFTVQEERWKDLQIRLLITPEHAALAPRYLKALKFALEYLEQHVGKYPYSSITVVDPPLHGLRSGLMEYPTLVTVGSIYGMPAGLRLPESLVVHEFVHQYFMGMLASNEKEEAWLDEGFVTYFEDRIIDASYGNKQGLVDFAGLRVGNRELTRLEYTTMKNPREGIVARPGWFFNDHNFKALIYSKTATALRSVHELVGEAEMDRILRAYFEKWKFRHPRGSDFMALLQAELLAGPHKSAGWEIYGLFEKSIQEALVLDYAVVSIVHEKWPSPQGVFGDKHSAHSYRSDNGAPQLVSKVEVQRKGDWIFPVELLVIFEDGSTQRLQWSGVEGSKTFEFEGRAVLSAQIDPDYKIGLDIDLNNNSFTQAPEEAPLWKYGAKTLFWAQNLFQSLSFLM